MPDPNQVIADIARNLADALLARAKSRSDADQKRVLALQTELCAEAHKEKSKIDKECEFSDRQV